MGTCMNGTAYVINDILLLHAVHAFGVHMSWCMGCMWYICPTLAISDTTLQSCLSHKFFNSPSTCKVCIKATQCVGLCAGGSVHCYVHCSSV